VFRGSVDAFTNASEIASEGVYTAFGRVGLARGCEPSVDFVLDKAGIFEQSHDFRNRAAHGIACVGLDPDGTSILNGTPTHARRNAHFHPIRGGCFRHGLRDGAHAADGVAPNASLAVHFANAVMKKNIGRPRSIWTRIISDDAVEAENGFDGRVFKPAVEEVACRCCEKIEKITLPVKTEGANSISYRPALISSLIAAKGAPSTALGGVSRTMDLKTLEMATKRV
jgi:hypothetical protein